MAETKFDKEYSDLEQSTESQAELFARLESAKKEDATRQEVTKKFVDFYFWILILIVVGVPFYNYIVFKFTGSTDLALSFKDAVLTYSAVVGPTVGLVIAYYFKTKN